MGNSTKVPGKDKQSRENKSGKDEPGKNSMETKISDYEMGKVLGQGTYAEVRYATTKQGDEAAIKILFDTEDIVSIQNEIEIMRKTSHKNTVRLLGAEVDVEYNGKAVSYLILELAKNGELFQILALTGAFDDDIARLFAHQLYSVVAFFQEQGVTHRDLKPENILLDENCCIKIADFGLATDFKPGVKLTELVGSPGYIAPEVYKKSYDYKNDIWAAVVIHFILMTGCPPFRRALDNDWWYSKIRDMKWESYWKSQKKNSGVTLTDDAKAFFQMSFEIDPEQRPEIKDLLSHKWFQGETCKSEDLMNRFKKKLRPDCDEYGEIEEDVNEDSEKKNINRSGNNEFFNFALPAQGKGRKYDENTIHYLKLKRDNRDVGDGDDEGDKAEVEVKDYNPKIVNFTKFECTASPSDLLTRLQGICAAKKFAYKKYEDEPAALIITPNNIEGVVFMAQIFKKKNDKAESKDDKAESKDDEKAHTFIVELTRLKGGIRQYMTCYTQVSMGLGTLKNT